MMYSALAIAKHIIDYCNDNGINISNLKLQKILYFVQAEFLVSLGEPCFRSKIEAWDFGPVVPDVYHEYKFYGGASIPKSSPFYQEQIDNRHQRLIDNIVRATADYSAATLVEVTHNQDPWKNVYRQGQNREISNVALQNYFIN